MQGGNLAEALHGKLGVAMVPDARALTWDTGGKQLALRIVRGVIQLHSIQVRSPAEAACFTLADAVRRLLR